MKSIFIKITKNNLIKEMQQRKNLFWKAFNKNKTISIGKRQLVNKNSKIFTMGSCFAVEIRKSLKEKGFEVFPKYNEIAFDKSEITVGSLPDRENINYYHTFSMIQEFNRSLGIDASMDNNPWEIADHVWGGDKPIYQDPYRRAIFSRNKKALLKINKEISDSISYSIRNCNIFIFTLGLTEVWKEKSSGKFSCMNPGYAGGGGFQETDFYLSNFADNYKNIDDLICTIKKVNPKAKVIITTSPVPLGRTYRDEDVFVANMESKSTLRTVCGEISRAHEQVIYFPSYEIAMGIGDIYEADGRHVRDDIVKYIVSSFSQGLSG